jgi:hypothetical protein
MFEAECRVQVAAHQMVLDLGGLVQPVQQLLAAGRMGRNGFRIHWLSDDLHAPRPSFKPAQPL